MADEVLRMRAEVVDGFSATLGRLRGQLTQVSRDASATKIQKDWHGVAQEIRNASVGITTNFVPALRGVNVASLGISAALVGGAAALKNFAGETRDIANVSRGLGTTAGNLERISRLANTVAGMDFGQVAGSLRSFQDKLNEVKTMPGPTLVALENQFKEYGRKLGLALFNARSFDEAFAIAFDAIRNQPNEAKARALARELFGTDVWADVIRNATPGILKAIGELRSGVTKESLEASLNFNLAMTRMGVAATNLRNAALTPLITKVGDLITAISETETVKSGFANWDNDITAAKTSLDDLYNLITNPNWENANKVWDNVRRGTVALGEMNPNVNAANIALGDLLKLIVDPGWANFGKVAENVARGAQKLGIDKRGDAKEEQAVIDTLMSDPAVRAGMAARGLNTPNANGLLGNAPVQENSKRLDENKTATETQTRKTETNTDRTELNTRATENHAVKTEHNTTWLGRLGVELRRVKEGLDRLAEIWVNNVNAGAPGGGGGLVGGLAGGGGLAAAGVGPGARGGVGRGGMPGGPGGASSNLPGRLGGPGALNWTGTNDAGFTNPVPGARVISEYGASREGGARSHKGIDLGAPSGTPIRATTDQVITHAGVLGSKYGFGVKAVDSQGREHVYAHMVGDPSALGIQPGMRIKAGQVIGAVGNSGNARTTPSHLHYEVRPNVGAYNNAYNPRQFLAPPPGQPDIEGTGARLTASNRPVAPPDPNAPTAGLRNYNFGNLKFSASSAQKYPGVVGPSMNTDQGDRQIVFRSLDEGIKAAGLLAQRKYAAGKDTVNKLIAGSGGWTPGNYAAAANIARSMGIDPNDSVNLNDQGQLASFLRAMAIQEHGSAGSGFSTDRIQRALTPPGAMLDKASEAGVGGAAPSAKVDARGSVNITLSDSLKEKNVKTETGGMFKHVEVGRGRTAKPPENSNRDWSAVGRAAAGF